MPPITDHRSPIAYPATRRWLAGGLALAFGLAAAAGARAEQADALKAAFVLNFLKFAEWPASAPADTNAALVIAAVGNDRLAAALRTVLDGKTVQSRKVEVQVFRDAAEWKNAGRPCQALFVTPAAQPAWGGIRAAVAGRPVLTMGEAAGFCAQGGMLNLYEKENRIRFEANPEAVEKEGLRLRSELLKLATIVTTNR
jgi:hypothetical protein